MPEYKLTYFNVTGLGEPIRYVLAYAGADFEDNRIASADWPALKESLPYEQLPLLEVNGTTLHQSSAMCRYIAQKHGLEHEDILIRAQLEAIVDDMKDLYPFISAHYKGKTPETKKALDEALMKLFKVLNTLAAKGYFYGSTKPTWVDIYFAGRCESLEFFVADVLDPHPNLAALVKKVRNNEKIKKYINNKPEEEKF